MLTKTKLARIKLLTADLRANPHLQGYKRLKDGDKYCCLGRACLLAPDAEYRSRIYKSVHISECSLMSWEVKNYYGFPYSCGIYLADISEKLRSISVDLTSLNDSREFTFPMIADVIDYWADNQEIKDDN